MITNLTEVILGVIVVISIGAISLKARIIDKTGFTAALLVGCAILFFGGEKWFMILLTFHFTAAIFTKYKYNKKAQMEAAEIKGGARGWVNVMSNGAIASILAIFYGLTSQKMFASGYLAAISTSIADTLATEIGLLNNYEPRLITDLRRRVKPGTSGGVTILGETAGLFGGLLTAFVALVVGFEGLSAFQIFIFSLLVGFLGCNFDSVLGAVIQVVYECRVCGKMTESRIHCGQTTLYYKGNRFVDNNVVNFSSTIFGALTAILINFLI